MDDTISFRSGVAGFWRMFSVACACTGGLLTTSATADWPTDPGSPAVLGSIGGFGADLATAVTPDGATWAAWVDGECFGTLKVQRVSPGGTVGSRGGVELFPDDGCTSRNARIAACADGSVVVAAVDGSQNGGGGPLVDSAVQRINAHGRLLWGDGVVLPGDSGKVGQLLGLADGDVRVAWNHGFNVHVARYAPDGTAVWSNPATVVSPNGSSMRIFALVPDGAGGAFMCWDVPGTYTRGILAARVTAEGIAAWSQPLIVTPPVPASSRHTDPVALSGSDGELIVVWTEGAESAGTVVAVRMQRISPLGQMLLEPEGRRVSLAPSRQFSVLATRDAGTGDVYIAWRDGVLSHELRAQRMSATGQRLWGDTGMMVAPLVDPAISQFDAQWSANRLAFAVVDVPVSPTEPRVRLLRVNSAGEVDAGPYPLSDATSAARGAQTCLPVGGEAMVVAWFVDIPGFSNPIVAQRINSDGSLGLQSGDVTGDATVDINDLLAVIGAWGPCAEPLVTCPGDAAPPPDGDGAVNIDDLLLTISNWR